MMEQAEATGILVRGLAPSQRQHFASQINDREKTSCDSVHSRNETKVDHGGT